MRCEIGFKDQKPVIIFVGFDATWLYYNSWMHDNLGDQQREYITGTGNLLDSEHFQEDLLNASYLAELQASRRLADLKVEVWLQDQ
jgi:hypothetical protein